VIKRSQSFRKPPPLPSDLDLERLLQFSDSLLDTERDDARRVGYTTKAGQARCFAALARIFQHETSSFSVYEVGCGLAHMHDFLRKFYPLATYKGCDINARAIEQARRRHPDINLECRDILLSSPDDKYDYVLAAGTFNWKLDVSEDRWKAYIQQMLAAMYGMAQRGIAVDFLSAFAPIKASGHYHPDPSEMLAFAQRRLSSAAEIRHFYRWHFAVFVRREVQ
jgi:SAM-dependent methyltransferase